MSDNAQRIQRLRAQVCDLRARGLNNQAGELEILIGVLETVDRDVTRIRIAADQIAQDERDQALHDEEFKLYR